MFITTKSISWQSMQETPRHPYKNQFISNLLWHKHVIVLKPVLQLQRTILSRFGGAGGFVMVTGSILPF